MKTELALLRDDVEKLSGEVQLLKQEVKELLEVWRTATGLLSIIKWLAGTASAVAVGWAAFRGFK